MKRDQCRILGTEGEMELSPLNGPELIYPGGAKRGSRLVGLPLAVAPQLALSYVALSGGASKKP